MCVSIRKRQTDRKRQRKQRARQRQREAGRQAGRFLKGESLYLKESSLALQFLCPIYNSMYRIYWMH